MSRVGGEAGEEGAGVPSARKPVRDGRGVLYPNHYVWYMFASALDIMMTYAIIWKLGGREVNAIAARLVEHLGHWGLIVLKFATVIVVVGVCEFVGRTRPGLGRRLAVAAIVSSAFPVGYGVVQVAAWTHLWE
jgi:hypothetical protein